ncbi:ornithine cyclodeaminase [Clavibacter michiganensis]|uniref:2,3-diaminopropionate biosynthesis protein SbnB n=1 Tax=Clavibacter michiganensis TaxID=28447 RepID=UPI00195BB8CF|nr:2,3-diaminopropionate biosynthesis protein SbnB [Clavibacter michiganensis]MBM7411566.1 ornithine cyclodeaminase [Clavibacter michiganensis]
MTAPQDPRPLSVVPAATVRRVLDGHELDTIRLVEEAYRRHASGTTVNPRSLFLRFPDRPDARIIALPASLGPGQPVGIKWISSFPSNHARGLPRASAVLLLNDPATGFPVACMEASIVSATRTAASAASAARALFRHRPTPTTVGIVGTGLIASYVLRYLRAAGLGGQRIVVHDALPERAAAFAAEHSDGTAAEAASAAEVVRRSDLVVFATTAASPHVEDTAAFAHHPVVLHVSLRDLGIEVIRDAVNIVDDVEHCLTADTSVHLVEQRTGDRSHVHGTIAEVLDGRLVPPADATVVVSPFGLGVLDIAVGQHVLDRGGSSIHHVEGFFSTEHESAGKGTR